MFTGIVEEVGTIRSIRKGAHSCILTVGASLVLDDVHVGDSIATNGVCLTVTSFDAGSFSADVMHETLNRSSLGALKVGSKVNLERAMAANGRFGGHIVSGHIDGVGTIQKLRADDNAVWYTVGADRSLLRHVIEKGSITIDGISLTVAGVTDTSFSVSVIPHTRAVTSLSGKGVGDVVNLETDVIGKYVERLLSVGAIDGSGGLFGGPVEPSTSQQGTSPSGLTREFLIKYGF